jgi:hypothetical protein
MNWEAPMVRKGLIWLLVLAVVALDWAALHDILKGEPNAWMEWTIVIASMVLGVVYLFRTLRRGKAS